MNRRSGFTLVEILVTIGIVVALAVVTMAFIPTIITRMDTAACISNMKSLCTSLATYVHDNDHWPQEPPELWALDDQANYEDWWIETLKPYGGTEKVWKCPSIVRLTRNTNNGRPKIHYTPTMFDDKPSTPYKWPNQPWLVEIGNMHGHGAMVAFPDGSVRSMNDITK